MKLRLGLSIAINSNPDILILDEIVYVGDEAFRVEIDKKLDDFFHKGKTMLIVSHWLDFLKENCTRLIYISRISK